MSIGSDTFAAAPEIDLGANGPQSTAGLSYETGEPNTGWHGTVWWKYTATTDTPIQLDTDASTFTGGEDTLLAVFTGTAVDSLTPVVSDDDGGDVGYFSKLILAPEIGTTYYIQVCTWTTFDLVLTATELAVSPWRYDAAVNERSTLGTSTANGEGRETWQMPGYVDNPSPTGLPNDAMDLALSGTSSTPNPAYATATPTAPGSQAGMFAAIESGLLYLDGPATYQGYAQWSIGYVRHSFGDQTGDYSGSNSDLPADVWDSTSGTFVDPNVIGVLWGAPVATGNTRLQVQLLAGNYDDPARTWRIMYRADPSDSEVPGFRTRSELLADFTVIPSRTITASDVDSISAGSYFLPWWDVGSIGDLFAGNRVILAVVDQDVTLDGDTIPDTAPSWGITATTNVRQEYRLPYRLIYATAPATAHEVAALRNLQRGDGLEMSSAPRAIQNGSQQASLRNIGFQ